MATVVETFDSTKITNASVQFFDETGTQQAGQEFSCIGSIEGETTMKELIKKCEGVEVAKRTKPEKHDLTVSAHVPVQIVRDLFGLSNTDLKPGIYKYSQNSKGKKFVLTADVIDEFEEVTKLIAFPNCVSSTGFKFAIENGADEVAEMEVELAAYPDDKQNLYYEAFVSELEDTTIKDTWHTTFDYTLVELVATP
ncbi:phage tail protein [Pseudalkalibacillus caeni]|uniref:Phage tail protein n=1 Tax=Exobacillus caeni TaxID=2574798 RepID=A0A5R9F7Y3_9BACL|nr:phage tail protein [Pseudalkalibacillus caeni]TLS37738.1 phage tail protein [Pseudalkalibacillus caeni]